MTTDTSILAQPQIKVTEAGAAAAEAASALLVQSEPQDGRRTAVAVLGQLPEESPLASLPMQLDVMIPLPEFRVHHLLALEQGAVIESNWMHTEDVPVWCGGAQLVWAEFEVIDQLLAVRVTRVG